MFCVNILSFFHTPSCLNAQMIKHVYVIHLHLQCSAKSVASNDQELAPLRINSSAQDQNGNFLRVKNKH